MGVLMQIVVMNGIMHKMIGHIVVYGHANVDAKVNPILVKWIIIQILTCTYYIVRNINNKYFPSPLYLSSVSLKYVINIFSFYRCIDLHQLIHFYWTFIWFCFVDVQY